MLYQSIMIMMLLYSLVVMMTTNRTSQPVDLIIHQTNHSPTSIATGIIMNITFPGLGGRVVVLGVVVVTVVFSLCP